MHCHGKWPGVTLRKVIRCDAFGYKVRRIDTLNLWAVQHARFNSHSHSSTTVLAIGQLLLFYLGPVNAWLQVVHPCLPRFWSVVLQQDNLISSMHHGPLLSGFSPITVDSTSSIQPTCDPSQAPQFRLDLLPQREHMFACKTRLCRWKCTYRLRCSTVAVQVLSYNTRI